MTQQDATQRARAVGEQAEQKVNQLADQGAAQAAELADQAKQQLDAAQAEVQDVSAMSRDASQEAQALKDDPTIEPNKNAARDLLNCGVGICWQLMLVTTPLYIIFRDLRGTLISLTILVVTTVFLKKFWYDRLEPHNIITDNVDGVVLSPESAR